MSTNWNKFDLFTTLRNAPIEDSDSHALLCAFAEMAIHNVDKVFVTSSKDCAEQISRMIKDTGFALIQPQRDYYLVRVE